MGIPLRPLLKFLSPLFIVITLAFTAHNCASSIYAITDTSGNFSDFVSIGVGQTQPNVKLHVFGTSYLSGNVGIATATPIGSLENAGAYSYFTGNANGSTPSTSFTQGLGVSWNNQPGPAGNGEVNVISSYQGGSGANIGGFRFQDWNATTSVLTNLVTINRAGNVGIGTTGPGQKLDIAGGNGRVESGYNWLTNSDITFKKNITTLENVLDKVLLLRGVRYDLKQDTASIPEHGKQIGFIAQELEQQYPELVVTQNDGTKAVAYDKMTAVLVEAIKAQQKEIDELKKEIESLKHHNSAPE